MRIILVGAGGHAQVVADILLSQRAAGTKIELLGFVDDNPRFQGMHILDIPVQGPVSALALLQHDAVVVAIGDNKSRAAVFEHLAASGERFATPLHPHSIIAPDVAVGEGTMACAGVIVNTGSVIGRNTILNTGCTVDHHARVGDHVHVAPGVHLAGNVTVGEGAFIGIGAVVLPGRTIGAFATVGAGAVVTRDVPSEGVVTGIPARALNSRIPT